jgi:hypothetical protein
MKRALALSLILAACVDTAPADRDMPDGVLEGPSPAQIAAATGTPVTVGGQTLYALQKYDWPSMIAPIDPATGQPAPVQSGTADTVIISGSPDDRDLAIAALSQFCGIPNNPQGFDTQFVYRDPATGDWWFDGFRCRG